MEADSKETLKLVNTKNNFVVVSFTEGRAQFYNQILEMELQDRGIFIPASLRENYEGKASIFPTDPLFQKAFVEVYYPFAIANPAYQWQTEN